ncbi:MAG: fasciclin domain-containing protein [Flavobacteriales bacterium]|nr:fasciclin domain-containing protein [Flavobacteriales bacterium]
MNTTIKTIIALFTLSLTTSMAAAQDVTVVGGQKMYPEKNIIQNALNSGDHTTLVAAVQAAGLVETLKGDGPFTVFAPTNDAFENLPSGTVDNLLKKENKGQLVSVLTYHVVAGDYDYKALKKGIKKSDGKLMLKTVQGQDLYFTMNGKHNITVWDANGNSANISVYDVDQSNGIIQVIDSVLLPKS